MSLSTQHLWRYLSLSLCLVALGSVTLVSAQEEVATSTQVTATTTEVIAQTTAPWYTSDFISGDVAVGDFVVGPGKVEVTVRPGETVTKMMTVTNRIADDKTFELTIEDMSGSADPSVPVVLLGDQAGPYTLKNYISFPDTIFTLALGERAQIPVSITMPADAEPGGYYGSILVSTIQKDTDTEGASASSPIVARIGTLFFITVPGDFEKSGQVTEFSTVPKKSWFTKGPLNLGVLFENTGSMHLNPYGSITVENIFGEEVGFVEIQPWFVLPKSLRLREVTWDRELLLGRYKITAQINRGYDDVIDTKVIHIWVLPWQFMLAVFVGILFLFIVIKFITSRFEFKRKPSR